MTDNGQGVHLVPETDEEKHCMEFLARSNMDRDIHFQFIGRPIEKHLRMTDIPADHKYFLHILIGDHRPVEAT